MTIDEKVQDHLRRLGIPHEVMPCDPSFADTAAFCEHYGISPEDSANTIVVASKKDPKQYVACLVLADSKLDVNRTVSDLMGVKRLSFANADETIALTGMLVGGVTVFGLPPMPIYVDSRVMQRPTIVIGGGSRSTKIRLDPRHLLEVPEVKVVQGLGMVKG